MYLKAFFTKTTLWGAALLGLVLGVLVYASIDRTVVELEELVLVPDTVVSDSWKNTPQTLSNDVGEEALFQNFNTENAAYIDATAVYGVVETDETPSENVDSTSSDIDDESGSSNTVEDVEVPDTATSSIDSSAPETDPEIIDVDSPTEDVPPEEEQPEEQPEEPAEEVVPEEPTAFRRTGSSIFELLQETIEEDTVPVDPPSLEPEVEVEVVPTAEEAPSTEDSLEPSLTEDQSIDEVPDVVEDTQDSSDSEQPLDVNVSATSTEEESNQIESTTTADAPAQEIIEEESDSLFSFLEDTPTDVFAECASTVGCETYSTTFSGFTIPEFDSGVVLSAVDLRLSLGAKVVTESDIQRYVVEYQYADDALWRTATVIDIEDEVTNGTNGGYFLVSLDRPQIQDALQTLSVRVSYQGNINELERAYIEGVWLEVTSASFYNPPDPGDVLEYSRDLEAPKLHELYNNDLDTAVTKLPSFTMSYSPQEGFVRRAFNSIFNENTYVVDSVRLVDSTGTALEVPVNVVYHDENTWTVEILKQPQKLVPGKYTMELEVAENETVYFDSFEFYWGVLALNTDKSMYFENEEAHLSLAALTAEGDTICNAILELQIIDPQGSITDVPVEQSGACDKNNVTEVPDYSALYTAAGGVGVYDIQLRHLNLDGEVVHKIQDSFEVRDYIPYDIKRSGPTRIYPLAPYDVTIEVTAYRSFTGNIVERVPRGFVFDAVSDGAATIVHDEYTELVWENVEMKEGERRTFSYTFDAPNISPYLYLLGPLNMDGFTELRQWQIASDALEATASLHGTQTTFSANLNQATAYAMLWSSSTRDRDFFSHSTATNQQTLTIEQAGDYFVSVNLPIQRVDANNSRTRTGIEVRVNGVAVPQGTGRSGYIRGLSGQGQAESSSNVSVLVPGLVKGDRVEVFVQGLNTVDAGDNVAVSGSASMYVEYIGPTESVFAATTTQLVSGTDISAAAESSFLWTETREDTGFVHSNTVTPENITISNAGTYLVTVNIPLSGAVAEANVYGRIKVNGTLVTGGEFKQGFISNLEGDTVSSLHYSGVVRTTAANGVLTITAQEEGEAATLTTPAGLVGSVFVRRLPTSDILVLSGTQVRTNSNDWNPATAQAIQWSTQTVRDATVFNHSTTTNNHIITINEAGDYLLAYNDATIDNTAIPACTFLETATRIQEKAPIVRVTVNGVAVSGAQAKTHYTFKEITCTLGGGTGDNNNDNSSGNLVYLLEGVPANATVSVTLQQEAATGVVDDSAPATLLLWQKTHLDERPFEPTLYDTPFDNVRFASTTPYFDFSVNDPDGTSTIQYEFSISTSSTFTASSTFRSGVNAGFVNTVTPGDTAPFNENERARYQLQSALTQGETYYWRVRGYDVLGSNRAGDWSPTQSLTVETTLTTPSWFQTKGGQFESNALIGTPSTHEGSIGVGVTTNSEVLLAYGEGTQVAPRYRFWDGATWGPENNAAAVSGTINWVRTASAITRDEYVMVTLDSAADAIAQVYNGTTDTWGNLSTLSGTVNTPGRRGIAVGYESVSGDALVVSCATGADPVYSIWNGSSWTGPTAIDVTSVNNCNYLELASDPSSDEMILVIRNTTAGNASTYEALVWNGSAWTDRRVIGSATVADREGIAVQYESTGDQAVITVSNAANPSLFYTTWNGTEFSLNTAETLGDDFAFGRLVADPAGDNLVLCYVDNSNDIGALRWNGGSWATFFELDTDGNSNTGRPTDCVFETIPGRSGNILQVYSDTTNVRYRFSNGISISAEASVATVEDSFWVRTERAGDGTVVSVTLDDTIDDLEATHWNGTSWASETLIEGSPSSVLAAPYQMYDLAPKRFASANLVLTTKPIKFSFVPNQPTWGDVTVNTTEPFGTDVLIKVKYTSTTACDTYVPNGTLPGNAAGFSVTDDSINISGLSTSTYSQICLEATLISQGGVSPTLNDWELTWVRRPKLVQTNYHWYAPSGSLTPTDSWPAGALSTGENTPITQSVAIDDRQTIRLRMALQGKNVATPQFAEMFKLQYGEATTCTDPTVVWRDVGATGSTTALWRGFDQSGISDNALLPATSTLLSESDFAESYDENPPTRDNQNTITVGSDAEWDFSLQNNGAPAGRAYCFRAIYNNGRVLNRYNNYPRLVTNAPPEITQLFAPFDNERIASTTPYFEFAASDAAGDTISYQVQVDDDYDFGSTIIDRNSVDQFAQFYNLVDINQKSEFTSGQRIELIPTGAVLSNGVTYYWRVRGMDPFGADVYSDWSSPSSFTIATNTLYTTWFQTTGEQFATDELGDVFASTSTDDVRVASGFPDGTISSTPIDFDDRTTGNAWGSFSFTHDVTSGSILYHVEYEVSDNNYIRVPDAVLPGNAAGFTSSPISLLGLNTIVYNKLRLTATLTGNTSFPRLLDWTVTWDDKVEIPTHVQPFDNAKVSTTTPVLLFYSVDPENDTIQYELQYSTSSTFTASTTVLSGVSAGFVNTEDGADTSPFNSSDLVGYTLQSPLSNGTTYWWRVRARDPLGDNVWSDYSMADSFTVDTAVVVSTWFQTTGEQFATNDRVDIATTTGAAVVSTALNEVLMVYGEGTGPSPLFRFWNGSTWSAVDSADSVGAQIRWIDAKAAPTRQEYIVTTSGTDGDVNAQVYDGVTGTWDDVRELTTALTAINLRGFHTAYETVSGDALAVSCNGSNALYSVWNGTSWTTPTALTLTSVDNCEYIELASDPTSDEIIGLFRKNTGGITDYQLFVWNGSSWGNQTIAGSMQDTANVGAAIAYEDSGNQAVAVVSNGAAATFISLLWSGTAWSSSSQAIVDDLEWAVLTPDDGSDRIALCYIDESTADGGADIFVRFWSGSAWGASTEITPTGNDKLGLPVDCTFETTPGRDGYLMVPYSDTAEARYVVHDTANFNAPALIDDAIAGTNAGVWRVHSVRGGDGRIHTAFFDDVADRYVVSNWNGSAWSALNIISTIPSITGTPFDGSLAMAPRIFPDITSGVMRSTPINFADGSGPRWERAVLNDTTGGSSLIKYRVYYKNTNGEFVLVPDAVLPNNAAGFTGSTIDLSELNRNIYSVLSLEAEFICVAGTCPTLQDWSVEWSEGIDVSGVAYATNGVTPLTAGTVGIAVNGAIQVGKTGAVQGDGTWLIDNVTIFEGDIVTTFLTGEADGNEGAGVTIYDGVGNVLNMQVGRGQLALGANDNPTITNGVIGHFDNGNNEDLFFNVDPAGVLTLCAEVTGCADSRLKVLSGTTYVPGANGTVVHFQNLGTTTLATSTLRVGGDWAQSGTFNPGDSTVIFTATTSARTLTASSTHSFFNLTFGEGSGAASWTLGGRPLEVLGSLNVTYGTLARATSSITIARSLAIGTTGFTSGIGTTTFNGIGSYTWADAKASASSSNIGHVVIDGTTKTITLAGNVGSESVTIGSDDTLNASGSGFNINVVRNWTNSNAFVPTTGTVTFVGTSTGIISRGASSFNNLSFTGVGGNWSFATNTLALSGTLTIATGTVTLPTGTTTIGGSFTNTGGTYLHNNGEVRMTSNAAGRTIRQSGTAFLNNFYDLVFSGNGTWSFVDSAATTSRHFRVDAGTVTLPSGTLTVGRDFLVQNTGAVTHNNGELIVRTEDNNLLRTNGSALASVRVIDDASPVGTRTFTDTNLTLAGTLRIETNATATFPTGVLAIAGSFDNNGAFNANAGTVRFNSTTGAKTIAAGNSSFATLDFNAAGGDFTVVEHATATIGISLTAATQFTVASGQTLAAQGSFNQLISGTSTTWTGSTLRLLSGTSTTLNAKTHGGDVYGTLEAASSTLVRMWNASANSYVTNGATGAIYSQDHAGVNGDLNIYGNYTRTTGTEYWSFAIDFDGVSLLGQERQVDVRIASSSQLSFTAASLSAIGGGSASTTVSSLTGTFGLTLTNATLNSRYTDFAGTSVAGVQLTSSSTIALLEDTRFSVAGGATGITVDASTVNTNATNQYFRVGFATSTPGTAYNVSLLGAPNSFIWFREGNGGLYGEAYDFNDSDPGAIRFDDSSYLITISGTVYADDGVTPLGAPTCNDVTPVVRVVVDGGAYTNTVPCASANGAYVLSNVAYVGDPRLVVYLDTNGGVQAAAVTKTPTANISNFDLYQHRVITRHEDVLPLTIADMTKYDSSDDTDIRFSAATGTTNTLLVQPNTELFVFASTTFTPQGEVTLLGNGNANSYEGTLALGAAARFVATGTETHTLAGRLVLRSGASFVPASSTVIFNATTTGKSLTSTSTITLHTARFVGIGGGWNIGSALSVSGEVEVATGTVTGTGNVTLTHGSLYGNGTLAFGAGTTTIMRTNTLGGTTPWTFNNLVLGSGAIVGTTTPAGSATTTILGRLTIAAGHYFDANTAAIDLAGSGTVFVETGTFIEDQSTVRYSGSNAAVLSTNYYNLALNSGFGTATYTPSAIGFIVGNNLSIGGTAQSIFAHNTSDPLLDVVGTVRIAGNGVFDASASATTTVRGSWNNDGLFTSNGGRILFAPATSTTATIEAGASSFATVRVNGPGAITVAEHATATAAFVLQNASAFTVAPAQSLAVGGQFENLLGGAATTWASSTLGLYGIGTYTINPKTVSDMYGTLRIASSTQIRMWNSAAATYTVDQNGSLYSQDHADVSGDAYVWGRMIRTTGADFWSYATDFDGAVLTGGDRRVANVYVGSGARMLWQGASLSVVGESGATSTIQNQGTGTYSLVISTSTTATVQYWRVRDTDAQGVTFTGSPIVSDFSHTDHLVALNSGSALTVFGSVINANEAKNFTDNTFNASGGVTNPYNVTASGTTVSSWRFTNHLGGIDGEAFDLDPAGDPGYIVWDDSAALITISGNVYNDEAGTVSSVCNGSTQNIRLVVAGLTTYNTSCAAGTGAYSISGVAYSPMDTLTLFINGESVRAASVASDPVSSISNLNLYHDRVVVRHENADPITIAKMSVYDSSEDADIPFTATTSGAHTLTLATDKKLIIWNSKNFTPNGTVTLTGGSGAAYSGTLEAYAGARFTAKGGETHTINGSLIFNPTANFVAATSTVVLGATVSGRSVSVNSDAFYNLTVQGGGAYAISGPTFTVNNNYVQSAGTITFPTGTSTVGNAFNVTGGSFIINGSPLFLTSTALGTTVRFNNSPVANLSFTGRGTFLMTDTNATSTGAVTIATGTVSLPSGIFAVGASFVNAGGIITHNTAELVLNATSSALLTARGSDLHSVRFNGTGPFTVTDTNVTFLDSFTIASGSVLMASGTTAVGGSFSATGGQFNNATGTVLLNAPGAGRTINPGTSAFYNLQIGAPAGGYTLFSATTTNNFTLAAANILTLNTGAVVRVGGVFTNSVGGAATTWTNSTLILDSNSQYDINTKITTGDTYGTLAVGDDTDIRVWNSSAATTTTAFNSSLYSQDHANVNGDLYIYGDFAINAGNEYWSYGADFDGTPLTSGNERQVDVRLAANSTTTVFGALDILGGPTGATTTIAVQGSGSYAFVIDGGTLDAEYYAFDNLNSKGLALYGLTTIDSLSNGYFNLRAAGGTLVTLSSTTLNYNPSKLFVGVGFDDTSLVGGFNVTLLGETANAWRFTSGYGAIEGEDFDVDGIDECGSVRFSDSACLLTAQTHIRFRNDDGGEGVPDSEWYDLGFDYRTRVRLQNEDQLSYATTAVRIVVPYDNAMQSDFSDLRFTSDDGQTPIPFWVERFTASNEADVWVKVTDLPGEDFATVFYYYGSSTATSISNGDPVFTAFDDYEDNNITEYSGNTTLFTTVSSPVYGGDYALAADNTSGRTPDGIFRFDQPIAQGSIIRYQQYVDTVSGSGDEPCVIFAVQSPGTQNDNYGVCLEQFGVDRLSLARDVIDNDTSGVVLSSTTVSYSTGWYEVEIDWHTGGQIEVALFDDSGLLVATTSATNNMYTSGGHGYTFWFQSGAWDSFVAYNRLETKPTVYLGARQTHGGATWRAVQNAPTLLVPGSTFRLRVAIENSGLAVDDQLYRLEYADKGAALTCQSVAENNFETVPNQASCNGSPLCMQNSSFVNGGDPTTDHLLGAFGTFSVGEIVENPDSQTGPIDIDQNFYTELEYVVSGTVDATGDAYCLRVTQAGTPLDFYASAAELNLRFDPVLDTLTLNGGSDISLTPGTTTAVTVFATTTDLNGFADLTHATATIYRGGAGPSCTPDNNNCYKASTNNGQCSFTGCSGSACQLTCTVNIAFHADPTDLAAYEGEEWLAFAEVSDAIGGYDFNSAPGVELLTLRALAVDSLINYGSLIAGGNTGTFNPTTTIANLGNSPIDIDVEGTALTDGQSSAIPADRQKVATSTFNYSACVTCYSLPNIGAITLDINLTKPNTVFPPVATNVYWGIAIPELVNNAPHSGTNIFTAVGI